jgi:hypothetical protein
MTPEAIYTIWLEKASRRQPDTATEFREPSKKAEFLARPEVAELSKLDNRLVIAAFLEHLNLARALTFAASLAETERRTASAKGEKRRPSSRPSDKTAVQWNNDDYHSSRVGHRPRDRPVVSSGRMCPACDLPEESCRCSR